MRWIRAVVGLVLVAGVLSACHGAARTTGVLVSWSCVIAPPAPWAEPTSVSGTVRVEADSPGWATPGSDIPMVNNVRYTDMSGDQLLPGLFLRVTGATWTGGEVADTPALGFGEGRGVVTASAPGEVVVEVAGGLYFSDSAAGFCEATGDAPIARIQVVGKNPPG
jgi:hypothetical protein